MNISPTGSTISAPWLTITTISQSLQFQQIYGGGIGYTIIKDPKQTLDLKALIQYERQNFIDALLPGENQNLIGSTFSANYLRHLPKGMLFNQQVAYIPAWNNLHAYSFTELDTFSIPAYKRLESDTWHSGFLPEQSGDGVAASQAEFLPVHCWRHLCVQVEASTAFCSETESGREHHVAPRSLRPGFERWLAYPFCRRSIYFEALRRRGRCWF